MVDKYNELVPKLLRDKYKVAHYGSLDQAIEEFCQTPDGDAVLGMENIFRFEYLDIKHNIREVDEETMFETYVKDGEELTCVDVKPGEIVPIQKGFARIDDFAVSRSGRCKSIFVMFKL